jgi:lectin-like protein
MVWVGLLALFAACSFTDGNASRAMIDANNVDAPDAAMCAASYTLTYGGHHYAVTPVSPWGIDASLCGANRAHLIKIEDSGEDAFAHSQFTTGYMWIGLHLNTADNHYYWPDGSQLGSYNNFLNQTPPPPNTGQQCIEIVSTSGLWQTYDCNFAQTALCECP